MPFVLTPPSIKKWRLARSSPVRDYGVFRVDQHAVRDGDDRPRRDVFTFACPEWCNVLALTERDEVVFVWQYRFGTDAMSLEIPGGVVDAGESPVDAARRELREETGFDAGPLLEPLLSVEANPALQNNRCHTFVTRGARPAGPTAFDENEELEVVLVPLAHLEEVLDAGHVTHALVHGPIETFLRKERRRAR